MESGTAKKGEVLMSKRRMLIAIVMMSILACAGLIGAYLLRDPINESACARIREGMTEAEVIEVLGRPCDVHLPYQVSHFGRIYWQHAGIARQWDSRISIYVNFDEDGIVTTAFWLDRVEREKSTFQRVRHWLGFDPPVYRIHDGVGPATSSI